MSGTASRLGWSFVTYVLLLVGVVTATGFALWRQHDDGVTVNLSGRQRMLTQRITHQLMTYAARAGQGADTTDARTRVRTTMRVFEVTLDALIDGGPAPIDLQLASFRSLPKASPEVMRQLANVRDLYTRFRQAAEEVLDGSPRDRQAGIETVALLESDLLARMDTAVVLIQREAETKVNQLLFFQAGAVLGSLLLTFAVVRWVRSGITAPLEKLREAAEEMSLGNLHKQVPVEGSAELRSLAESFERMRLSLQAILSPENSDSIGDELASWSPVRNSRRALPGRWGGR